VVLAIFLIVAIVATVYLLKIMKQVKQITARAENVAENLESAANTFQRAASPLAFLKLLSNIVEHTAGGRRKKG